MLCDQKKDGSRIKTFDNIVEPQIKLPLVPKMEGWIDELAMWGVVSSDWLQKLGFLYIFDILFVCFCVACGWQERLRAAENEYGVTVEKGEVCLREVAPDM